MEARLKAEHKTVALALHEKGQQLERQIAEINAALRSIAREWASLYGLPDGKDYAIFGKGDGDLYLMGAPDDEN